MQSWQTVVVCVAVALVSQGALGHPRALEEDVGPAPAKGKEDGQPQWIPLESSRKHSHIIEDESKKSRSALEDEDTKKTDIQMDEMVGAPQEIVKVGTDKKKNEDKFELTEVKPEINEGQDSTRSKKSPDMRELSYHAAPTTTVCIQVRSNHNPQVVCGPQVGDDKKEEKIVTTAPRYVMQPSYPSQAYYDPRYIQQEQLPKYMRASPQDIEPSRPYAAPGKMQMAKPQQMSPRGPVQSPKAARGPQIRTQTEDDTPKAPEGPQPAGPTQPFRIIPQGPPPASVVVHKQYYQAAPLSPIASNFISPYQPPLRLNCALQPEGAQFLQSYGTPMLRTALPGYVPVGGDVIIPDNPRSAQGPDFQEYYYDPQGRTAPANEMSPYEYAEPWAGTTFVGEDGQLYKVDDSQGRAAMEDPWEQANLRAAANGGMTMDDLRSKYQDQEKQLQEASARMQNLQSQLERLQQRSNAEEKKKEHSSTGGKESAREPPPESSDDHKKPPQNKNKRNSFQTRR